MQLYCSAPRSRVWRCQWQPHLGCAVIAAHDHPRLPLQLRLLQWGKHFADLDAPASRPALRAAGRSLGSSSSWPGTHALGRKFLRSLATPGGLQDRSLDELGQALTLVQRALDLCARSGFDSDGRKLGDLHGRDCGANAMRAQYLLAQPPVAPMASPAGGLAGSELPKLKRQLGSSCAAEPPKPPAPPGPPRPASRARALRPGPARWPGRIGVWCCPPHPAAWRHRWPG